MKRASTVFAIITGLVLSANSESVSISGTITGDGSPISDARVTLKNMPSLVTYTDESGAFSLSNTAVLHRQGSQASANVTVRISNNAITLKSLEKFSSAEISLFDIAGKRLFSKKFTNLVSNALTIPLNTIAPQISLLQLSIDNRRFTAKCLDGTSMNLTSNSSSAALLSGNLQKSAESSTYVDSLIISARSWKNSIIALSDYEQTITEELTASNPWKPSGDLTYENGMVKILANGYDFEMGQPDTITLVDAVYSEEPVHTVSFTYDFWMDTAEVTQKQFDDLISKYYSSYIATSSRSERYGVGDNIPVYFVCWDDAAMYCNLKSKEDGLDTVYSYESVDWAPGGMFYLNEVTSDITKNGYRLPTEAEWEYACRGGTATDYYWGKNYSASYPANSADSEEVSEYAIWDLNSENNGEDNPGYGIHEIGTTKPNAYGLYNMAGNLSEHIHDFETMEYSYGTSTDPAGPEDGEIHMVRGGNWTNEAVYLRSASRNLNFASYSFFCVGFRAVKTVK